ncbi:MAG: divergent polysaccharide deacetylase family protein [Gemmatimonadota bacterium]
MSFGRNPRRAPRRPPPLSPRMVRRWPRPAWHLGLTAAILLAVAGAVLVYQWRSRPAPEPPLSPGVSEREPAGPAAFADSLAAQIGAALAEVGIWPELIAVRRAPGPRPVARIQVRVPGDLPLPVANLAVSHLAAHHLGQVLRGAQVDAATVDLYLGPVDRTLVPAPPDTAWPPGAVVEVRLRRDSALRRRVGRIALVVTGLGPTSAPGLVDSFLALTQTLTVVLPPGGERPTGLAARVRDAGHEVLTREPADSAAASGDVVIDRVADRIAMEERLWELAARAADYGRATGVAHGRESTLRALKALLPRLESRGHEFVAASKLAR